MIDVLHPKTANVSKKDLTEQLAKQFKVKDEKTIFVFGFKTAFGGMKSTGFACIYDTLEDALDTEPKYRLIRQKMAKKRDGSRKSRKDTKNKRAKVRVNSRIFFVVVSVYVYVGDGLIENRLLSSWWTDGW